MPAPETDRVAPCQHLVVADVMPPYFDRGHCGYCGIELYEMPDGSWWPA